MTDDRERWALILGASSGMGEATALALAARGYLICGIHLDTRATGAHVEEIRAKIAAAGSEELYINMNAADDEKRAAGLATLGDRFDRSRAAGRNPYLRVVVHSLAFGSLVPYITDDPKGAVNRRKMEMTADVMAHSRSTGSRTSIEPVSWRPARGSWRSRPRGPAWSCPPTAGSRQRRPRWSPMSVSSPWSSGTCGPGSRSTPSRRASR